MAVTVRNSSLGGATTTTSELLTAYITEEIKTLEPQLQYARLGVKRNIPKGMDRLVFPQFNQIPVKINKMPMATNNSVNVNPWQLKIFIIE